MLGGGDDSDGASLLGGTSASSTDIASEEGTIGPAGTGASGIYTGSPMKQHSVLIYSTSSSVRISSGTRIS